MSAKKKAKSQMDKLTRNYEKFIKGKELKQNGKSAFNKAIKKATKGRSSK